MTCVAPSLAVDPDKIAGALDAAGVRYDHEVVAAAPGRDERLLRHHGGDPDRRVRLLHRPRGRVHVAKTVEHPSVRHPVLGPEPRDDVDAFLETCAALVHADTEDLELLRDERAPKADVEPAAADVVEHPQLARELHGVVERGDDP